MKRRIPGNFRHVSNEPLGFDADDGSSLNIVVLGENTVRVVFTPPSHDKHSSLLRPSNTLKSQYDAKGHVLGKDRSLLSTFKASLDVSDNGKSFRLSTALITVTVSLLNQDLTLTWHSVANNSVFLQDLPFRAYEYDLDGFVHHYTRNEVDSTHYYGMGERASPLALNGRHLKLECLDALGYNPEHTDPLYKHFPLYYALSRATKEAYGVFYDSMANGSMDFGCEIDALWGTYCCFKTQQPVLDYYVVFGPSIEACNNAFANIIGGPALVPKYALGYLASSMGYAEAENAQELIEKFPELCKKWDIPCDVLHLSSGYTVDPQNGARNVFTWNSQRFPDPPKMFGLLRDAGIKTVANVKPWLLFGHPAYPVLLRTKGFVWDDERDAPSVTRLWSAGAGDSSGGSYFDLSSTGGRSFWKQGVRQLLDVGVEGIWNDNNEYSIHDDLHTYAMLGEAKAPVSLLGRSLQTVLMASASYEAMVERDSSKRPYLITRSCAPGAHRFAAQTWSGDNYSSWQTLKHNIPMGLNAGLSFMAGYGHDVGGFVGPRPEMELFVRWVQNGVFHPRFCIHSWKSEGITEPWMYPEAVDTIRRAIHLRYQLIPYLYTLHHEAHAVGNPVIRPLLYHFQEDDNVSSSSFDFLLGPALLVASVYEKGIRERTVYLPTNKADTYWCDIHTGEWFVGGQTVTIAVPLEQCGALFSRSGAMIPTGKVMQYVNAEDDDVRIVWVYPSVQSPSLEKQHSEFIVVDDDGLSLNAPVFRYKLYMEWDSSQVSVGVDVVECGYKPPFKCIEFSLPLNDRRVLVAGSFRDQKSYLKDGKLTIKVPLPI